MNNLLRHLSSVTALSLVLIFTAGTAHAQLVTNGSFESSNVGQVNNADVKGWLIQWPSSVTPAPVFEIVNDTVEQGNRALKVTVHGLGTNFYDIQAVADSIPVLNGKTYDYSIWAKCTRPGGQASITVGNYAYAEYKVIRPAALTTQWQKFTMQFTVNDNQTFIRGPVHFNFAADTGNSIYIDNLQIIDDSIVNAGKKPVIVEAESGKLGSNYSVLKDNNITYVSENANYTGLTSPGDTSRMITYQVTFADSGTYNLFAHLRVGPNGFNDDSFFYGKGFGEKNDTAGTDWVFINGLAAAGFSGSTDYVDGPGTLATGVWKWVNITKNSYQGTPGVSFYVSMDSLTKTFQIGSREDGLDIDKFAFGKTNFYFTVENLDSVQAGSTTMQTTPVDSSLIWKGPALAAGQYKFLGNVPSEPPESGFTKYWNQLTPGNAGKWASVAGSSDTLQWNWSNLDAQYNYAMTNHLVYKHHNLIWGSQQPSWISGLDSATQYHYIETWIRNVGQRYPKIDMVDVVNEPMYGHNPPDGENGRANYEKALGGQGKSGWDWLITAYKLARKYMPSSAKLLINDYNIIYNNQATISYVQIINLLQQQGLIDGIGVQCHSGEMQGTDTSVFISNLDRLGATGLPVYVSELDLGTVNSTAPADDNYQLQQYQRVFPVLWRHPSVKGITLWGYVQGQMWDQTPTSYLVNSNGTVRPAFTWLAQFIKDNPTGVKISMAELPTHYQLAQNFPNPFNPTTEIQYSVPRNGHISLKVYNLLGQEVAILFDGVRPSGNYIATFNGAGLASGVYFYRFVASNFIDSKKLMLLK